MRPSRNDRPFRAALVALSLFWGVAAAAADLSELKARGLVGERADGYLGLVPEVVPVEAKQLVDEINARRKTEYERIAASNNLKLSEVEALAGKKTLRKTAEGGWIFTDSWRQK